MQATIPILRIAGALALLSAGAGPRYRDVTLNRTVRQDDVMATLQKLIITGSRDRQSVSGMFRITDIAGRSLTIVKDVRMTLVETKATSGTALGRPTAALSCIVPGLREQDVKRVRTVGVDAVAANVEPTAVWENVPVLSPNKEPDWRYHWSGRGGQARLTAIFRGVSTTLLGNQPVPTIMVQVEEVARMRRPVQPGLVIVEAKGLKPAQATCATNWHTNLYEANLVVRGNGETPGAVTIRYYSAVSVARALRPYHFTFSNVAL